MSKKPNANEEYALPTEPPELVAKRDKLLSALEKQAKTATGTAQPVLRKMHELLASTRGPWSTPPPFGSSAPK